MPRFLIVCVLVCYLPSSAASTRNCRPDVSREDKISKERIDIWAQQLFATGLLHSMVNTSEIGITATVGRYGNVNAINLEIQKKEESATNAEFESAYRGAKGSQFFLGFKGASPVALVVTDVGNAANVQQGLFGAKGVTSVVLSAAVSDSDLAALRNTLTTKPIDAVRIALSGDRQVEQDVDEKNGQRMMDKFACYYEYLDGRGIKLSASPDQTPAGAVGAGAEPAQQLDLLVEDILAQDKLTLQAMMHHDMSYLDKHIADDAIFTSKGKKLTKRMLLAQVMEQQEPPRPVKSRYSEVSSSTTGDVVEVTSTGTLSIQNGGGWKDFYVVRGTTKYRKVNGEWIMLGSTNEYEKSLR